MARGIGPLLLAVALLGCGPSTFLCMTDAQCPSSGACQATGFCSVRDPECESGQRYAEHTGDGLAGRCVDPVGTSSSTGTPGTSSSAAVGSGSSSSSTSDSSGDTVPADWWDPAWTRRQRITIEDPELLEPLTNVPVLIVLDGDRSEVAQMAEGGTDLAFVLDGIAAALPIEVDTWATDGPSFVWIRLPAIPAEAPTSLWMYYGGPAQPGPIADAGVWDDDFAAVWHLGDPLRDSKDPRRELVDIATVGESGRIGEGRRFGGANASIDAGTVSEFADLPASGFTVSAWLLAESYGGSESGRILDKSDAIAPTLGFSFEVNSAQDNRSLQFDRGGKTEGAWRSAEGSIPLGQWKYVAVTYADGGDAVFVIDGALQLGDAFLPWTPAAASDEDAALLLGNTPANSREFDGILDEVRVSSAARSEQWLGFEYRTGIDAVVQFGEVEELPLGG